MDWASIAAELASLISSEPDEIANFANASALLFERLNAHLGTGTVNWCGFYRLVNEDTLVLGPFQGKVACIRIPLGSGVCGQAAAKRQTLVVDDVADFPGHIACDSASKSEVVVPIFDADGTMKAILDVDSSVCKCFTPEIVKGLEKCMAAFCRPRPATPPRRIKHAH